MSSLAGKVALISGVARGQGRSHAVRLAEQGVDIIGFDICDQLETVEYPMATDEDLAETVRLVEKFDRRIVAARADVRDEAAVRSVVAGGIDAFGRIDIVLANAGIMSITGDQADAALAWHEAIDTMLTGVMHTIESALPAMIEGGEGGSIVITSSVAGLRGLLRNNTVKTRAFLGYVAAKHGVVGLMRAYANALGEHRIRVNTVHPTGVNTPMIANDQFTRYGEENPTAWEGLVNVLPVPLIESDDVSNAILWLCSDAARYVTGVALPVDAGNTVR